MIHLLTLLLSIANAAPRSVHEINEGATARNAASQMTYQAPSKTTVVPTSPQQRFECVRTVFAEVDPKETEDAKASFMLISSLPYAVDVVEKRKDSDILRISYYWPQESKLNRRPTNPLFSASVIDHLRGYKPKRVWTEMFSKYCY